MGIIGVTSDGVRHSTDDVHFRYNSGYFGVQTMGCDRVAGLSNVTAWTVDMALWKGALEDTHTYDMRKWRNEKEQGLL